MITEKTFTNKTIVVLGGFAAVVAYVTMLVIFLPFVLDHDISAYPVSEHPWYYVLLFTCIVAPLWETAVFVYAPLTLIRNLSGDETAAIPTLVISSAIFGMMHSPGYSGIIIQGVMGMVFGYVYLKNGYSYWSAVTLHAAWNLFCFANTW